MTNFLEQLTAEYYAQQGYFVKTNIKFGPRARGGYIGEIDVAAFHPQTLNLLHIETSFDANSWSKRKIRFARKFSSAKRYYKDIFAFPFNELKQIAIVGFSKIHKDISFGDGISIKSVPYFIDEIAESLLMRDPLKNAVGENFPLMRSMQFALHWGTRLYKEFDKKGYSKK